MPKISVIVPVYNAEKYLHRCIDSILAQTFTDFELLLIDDGSKDSSPAICDKYAEKDPRVRVFHKENGGVSSARNVGLDNAEGEWICFVDSDDFILKNYAFLVINKYFAENIDLIRGKITYDINDSQLYSKSISLKQYNIAAFLSQVIGKEFFIPTGFFRRTLIGKTKFDTSFIYLEDEKFYLELALKKPRCAYISLVFYLYFKNENSATAKYTQRHIENAQRLCEWIIAQIKTQDSLKEKELRKIFCQILQDRYRSLLNRLSENVDLYTQKNRIISSANLEYIINYIHKTAYNLRWWEYLPSKCAIEILHIRYILAKSTHKWRKKL